jgi:hypothetical protein
MNKQTVAIGLAFIGIVFFLANTFGILAQNVSTFGGVVFIMLSGLTWAFWQKK